MRIFAFLLLILAAVPAFAQVQVPESREAIRYSYAPIVKKAAPAVVNVYSRRVVAQPPLFDDPFFRHFFGENSPFRIPAQRIQNSLGSGVILDPSGLIVTNDHVIKDAQEIRVVLTDRREFEATVALADPRADLAVLKIDPTGAPLPTIALGDSDKLEVGDLVLAIGDPFGVGQTVTSGIVSALARSVGVSDFRSFIQTDAPINPGNSGGALVDLDGRLVGINTAIFSRSGGSVGLGFAIPSAMVRVVLEAAKRGKIVRPWLGASGQAVTPELAASLKLARPAGVLLNDIAPDSPASAADLRVGDVILSLDGHPVDDPDELRFRVSVLPLGRTVPLEYWRGDATRTANVTLVAPPELPPRDPRLVAGRNPLAGATIANLNPAYDDEFGFESSARGVVVSRVEPQSTAQRYGFEPGDIIASLDRQPVESVSQLIDLLQASEGPWSFSVSRKGRMLNVTLR
jgi:Do/DeqQ family serine protease